MRAGEVLCIGDDGALIGILEVVHLIGGHQHAELRAEVVVRDAARERAALNGLPQAPLEVLALIIHADDAALRAEERLVRRAGNDLRAVRKRVELSRNREMPRPELKTFVDLLRSRRSRRASA